LVSKLHILQLNFIKKIIISSEEEIDNSGYSFIRRIKITTFGVLASGANTFKYKLDDLLEDYELVGCEPNTQLWEDKWSAWLFQVIASLCVAQTLFGFTHNDLHSNNIVWAETEEKYLYYKTNDGKLFKVPTYGKIFKIIDFGRSIFSINEHLFISDDFEEENDAATQFNFPELNGDNSDLKVYPNPVTNGRLSVETAANTTKAIAIFDVLGKQVLGTVTNENTIDVSALQAGIYIIKITEAGKTATQKLVLNILLSECR
jgi:hypothetical protein